MARPGTAGGGKPRSDEAFAARVKALRQARDLTMHEVAQAAGLAPSTISKIEQGRLSPTYENILKLAAGLQVDVAELFGDSSSPMSFGRRSVTRAGAGARLSTAQYDYEMLCPDLAKKIFTPLLTTIKARSSKEFPGYIQHAGEEFIYVISGTVELKTDTYQPLVLEQGDCCYFDSMMGHLCVSTGDKEAVVLWVCSQVFFAELESVIDPQISLVQPLPVTRIIGPKNTIAREKK
ncbi:helix-turn-helix domain-containing protein [Methylobacterium indicum]|uniref:XRE family transcriptional regulator n=1 Tax=Methylobacterium indicum TaxID=1775910 RepID=A0A8H8WYH5_9HYPH|nr:XRE family transcriptional regulator [Methylobacterium indicum]BCM86730.1 XRE family transcriptional regulator [Methylobacterium indicum]